LELKRKSFLQHNKLKIKIGTLQSSGESLSTLHNVAYVPKENEEQMLLYDPDIVLATESKGRQTDFVERRKFGTKIVDLINNSQENYAKFAKCYYLARFFRKTTDTYNMETNGMPVHIPVITNTGQQATNTSGALLFVGSRVGDTDGTGGDPTTMAEEQNKKRYRIICFTQDPENAIAYGNRGNNPVWWRIFLGPPRTFQNRPLTGATRLYSELTNLEKASVYIDADNGGSFCTMADIPANQISYYNDLQYDLDTHGPKKTAILNAICAYDSNLSGLGTPAKFNLYKEAVSHGLINTKMFREYLLNRRNLH